MFRILFLLTSAFFLTAHLGGEEIKEQPTPTEPSTSTIQPAKSTETVEEEIEEIEETTSTEVIVPEKHIAHPHLQGSLDYLAEEDRKLFTPGLNIGHVADDSSRVHRRIVQRTIMLTEKTPSCGAILTFDDQLVPFTEQESSGLEVARAIQAKNARAIFFANVPGVSGHDANRIIHEHSTTEKRLEACQALLESKRPIFIQAIRDIIRLKNKAPEPLKGIEFSTASPKVYYTCEVYNHTAFHQDMKRLKAGSDHLALCLMGISFIEECLDEAYAAERPGWKRTRWFRFPFLHAPSNPTVLQAVTEHFNQYGLLSLGETQDSKDVLNASWKKAYQSLQAAKNNKRYNPKFGGAYSSAEQPIALFHTKAWSKVGQGILKAIP